MRLNIAYCILKSTSFTLRERSPDKRRIPYNPGRLQKRGRPSTDWYNVMDLTTDPFLDIDWHPNPEAYDDILPTKISSTSSGESSDAEYDEVSICDA